MTEIPERPSVEDNQREQVPHFQMGYKSYIICTSPRSGSTLLCKLLTNTNVAGVPNSYFHKPSLTNWKEVHGIAPNCLANRSKTLEAVLKSDYQLGSKRNPFANVLLTEIMDDPEGGDQKNGIDMAHLF